MSFITIDPQINNNLTKMYKVTQQHIQKNQ